VLRQMTHEVETSGLRIGGAWGNFVERIRVLELENQSLKERLQLAIEDKVGLDIEKNELSKRFHQSVSSLTEEFSGHMRSLQIIETVRVEKRALADKADRLEQICSTLTKELNDAKEQIAALELNNSNWKSKAIAEEHLVGEEKTENKILRDMLFKRDVAIESLTKQIREQEADISSMRHAISTKDRQLVLLVKERDRLKAELKLCLRTRLGAPVQDFDSSMSASPRRKVMGNDGPVSPVRQTGSPQKKTFDADTSFDSSLSFSQSMDISERQYKAIIRKLRADLEDAQRTISSLQGSKKT
jgi:regulator of replication initiation timing